VASARYPPGVARPKKVRLDELLVERGELATLKVAQGWILAGKVRVNDRIVTKPGTPIGADDQVVLRAPVEKYVSRGGLKLEAALARFGLEAAGARGAGRGARRPAASPTAGSSTAPRGCMRSTWGTDSCAGASRWTRAW
jgi:hypothetical protein